MLKWVIKITELESGVKCFLRGCLDAAMASEKKHQHAGLGGHRLLVRYTVTWKSIFERN